jgi:2,3-bisphosphoglycerate-dependent phosphoglycerate mutase
MAACLNSPLEVDPHWQEMDNGSLAGLPREIANQLYPIPAFRNPFEPIAGTGESEIALHTRAAKAVEQVVRRGPGRYLVVAHGGILNAALRIIIGAPFPVNFTGIWFRFSDLGYARFEYKPDRHLWRMLELSG